MGTMYTQSCQIFIKLKNNHRIYSDNVTFQLISEYVFPKTKYNDFFIILT